MSDTLVKIEVIYLDGQFFTNVKHQDGSFLCTEAQPNLDLSLASVMPLVREWTDKAIAEFNRQIEHESFIESLTCDDCGKVGFDCQCTPDAVDDSDPMDDLYLHNIDGGDRFRELQERPDYISHDEATVILQEMEDKANIIPIDAFVPDYYRNLEEKGGR